MKWKEKKSTARTSKRNAWTDFSVPATWKWIIYGNRIRFQQRNDSHSFYLWLSWNAKLPNSRTHAFTFGFNVVLRLTWTVNSGEAMVLPFTRAHAFNAAQCKSDHGAATSLAARKSQNGNFILTETKMCAATVPPTVFQRVERQSQQ